MCARGKREREKTSDGFALSRWLTYVVRVLFSYMNESFITKKKVADRFARLESSENHIL